MRHWLGVVVISVLLAACQQAPVEAPAATPQALREALLEADLAFAARAVEDGIEAAYQAFLAADAVQLPDGGEARQGKAAIMVNVADAATDSDFTLSWEPIDGRVAAGGDLGFTWGRYYLEGVDAEGRLYEAEGKYANFWQRDGSGAWRVVLDISNQNETLLGNEFALDDYLGAEMPAEQMAN